MSLRQVLTVFNTERQLNDNETALLNALRSWTDAERQLFIDSLSDKPQKKAGVTRTHEHCDSCSQTKRALIHQDATRSDYHGFMPAVPAGKKSAGGGGSGRSLKSKHASSLESAIKSGASGRQREQSVITDDGNDESLRCQAIRTFDSKPCGMFADHNVHHLTTAMDYHEFVAPSTTTGKSDAQSAAGGGD